MPSPRDRGATLAELLVVLVIVSVLAVVALPMAETTLQRRNEIALRETLRDVRTAIDRFHSDWRDGAMNEDAEDVSENGFPVSLAVLVTGVAAAEEEDPALRYLRRMPTNPFSSPDGRLEQQWRFIGYAQDVGERRWNEEDVYDLRPITDRKGLDGSDISDW